MAPRNDLTLDLDLILAAAFAILDAEGLDKLTMRKLGDRLSVKPSAFYWHYRNKAELLGLMGQAIYLRASGSVEECANWRGWLKAFGQRLHDSLRAHRDAARLIALAAPRYKEHQPPRAQELIAPLLNFGLTQADALMCTSVVICFCVGWATYDENPGMQALLGRILNFSDSFGFGLDALIAGLPDGSVSST